MRRLIDVKGDIVHIIWVAVKIMLEGLYQSPRGGFILTLLQRRASKVGRTGTGFINTTGNSERDSTVTAATVVLLLLVMVLLNDSDRIRGELLTEKEDQMALKVI